MTLHVISDLRRDLGRMKAQLQNGHMSPDQADAWFVRLDQRVYDIEGYLAGGQVDERIELTNAGGQPFRGLQPGRRSPTTRHLTVVDGGQP